MRSLALNLMMAVIWLFLQTEPTLTGFLLGALLGFGLLFVFRPILRSEDYVRRVVAAGAFALVFLREFIVSCAELMYYALFVPVSRLRPEFLIYDISGLTRMEILLLSHCISLTPGSNTVDVSQDFTRLYLHVLDCNDAEAVKRKIDETFKRGILAFTR